MEGKCGTNFWDTRYIRTFRVFRNEMTPPIFPPQILHDLKRRGTDVIPTSDAIISCPPFSPLHGQAMFPAVTVRAERVLQNKLHFSEGSGRLGATILTTAGATNDRVPETDSRCCTRHSRG